MPKKITVKLLQKSRGTLRFEARNEASTQSASLSIVVPYKHGDDEKNDEFDSYSEGSEYEVSIKPVKASAETEVATTL